MSTNFLCPPASLYYTLHEHHYGPSSSAPFPSSATFRTVSKPTSMSASSSSGLHLPPPPPDHLTQPEDPTQSRRIFAEFYQATTFSILTPLAAAVCAESDHQQDMEPEDSEPYLNTSDLDATIATTDTEAAGPTPPPPPKNKKCSGGPLPPPSSLRTLKRPHRTATTSTVAAKGSGRRWSSLPGMWHALLRISSTQWGDGIQGWPLVDANGRIFAVLAEDPLTAHPHWLHVDPVGWNAELAESNPEEYRENLASKEARWVMGAGLWSGSRIWGGLEREEVGGRAGCLEGSWWTREGVGGHGGFLPMFKYDEIAKTLTHVIVIEDMSRYSHRRHVDPNYQAPNVSRAKVTPESITTPHKKVTKKSYQPKWISVKLGEHPKATWTPGEVRNGTKVQQWELVDGQLVDGDVDPRGTMLTPRDARNAAKVQGRELVDACQASHRDVDPWGSEKRCQGSRKAVGGQQRGPPGIQETVLKFKERSWWTACRASHRDVDPWGSEERCQGSRKAVGATWTPGDVRNGAKEVGGWVVAPQALEGEDGLEEEEEADRRAGMGKPAVPAIEVLVPTPVVGKENTALTMDTMMGFLMLTREKRLRSWGSGRDQQRMREREGSWWTEQLTTCSPPGEHVGRRARQHGRNARYYGAVG
ncbi:hypothetical protein B0H16DRAFT_1696322 [Mycena metata]|uniref:Uncharacterized protein n=1 Tax=Mycena metata TaxID=1033252 RepID=A0AAD7I112_9AGAR|nr:hypothetical protein B0H16DRAFT_1696322 [Mycena metata]